jgi:homogentisate 1,2-dioxygenase
MVTIIPYGFSIHNFDPLPDGVHQPPPVHQTLKHQHLWFAPLSGDVRLHPKSIPAHTIINIDSDEVLWLVDGDFMSRNNIEQGHIRYIQRNSSWTSSRSNGKKHRS